MEASSDLETFQANASDEDSVEVPTTLLSQASPTLGGKDYPKPPLLSTSGSRMRLASCSSFSSESIKEDLEALKGRCHLLEIQERTERGRLEKQLECAINERRKAERKYEDLLKEVGSPPERKQEEASTADPSKEDEGADSLPELILDSNSSGDTETTCRRITHLPQAQSA